MMKLVIFLFVLAAVSAAVYAKDLDSLAKRERERRRALAAQATRAAAAFTNDDLEHYRHDGVESVARETKGTARFKGRDFAKEQAFWEREARRHERELARIDANIRRLEWRLREQQTRKRPGERLSHDPALEVLEDSLESLREERSRIDEQFRERARKAGAFPGWLRSP